MVQSRTLSRSMLATNIPVLDEYLAAFTRRDLQDCLAIFDEGAALEFGPVKARGRDELAEWHRARFAANLQVVRIDAVRAEGDTVVVDGVITSDRLKTWRLNTLSGRGMFRLEGGKITEARFGVRR